MLFRYLIVAFVLAAAFNSCGAAENASVVGASRATLGINVAGLADWSTELPFVDLMKMSRPWISQRKGTSWGKGPELSVDEHGWVTRLDPDCYVEVPMCTGLGVHIPSGEFVVLYDGKGTIEVGDGTITTQTPGRIAFTVNKASDTFWLRIRAIDPADHLRNIRVLIPGSEKTYKDNPFNPTFLNRWRGVSTLRFMEWMATNDTQVSKWGDRTHVDDYTWQNQKGAPVEIMVDLANRLGAAPWFCMPDKADDEYIRNFATYVKEHLDPKRKVYIEYSNEVWNGMFHQTHYAQQKGQELGYGPKERPWEGGGMYYAHRSVEIFKIWESVFGGHERLVRVIAWQAGNSWWSDNIVLPFEDAYKSADALAIAPYLTYLPSPGGNSLDSDKISQGTVDQVLDYVEANCLPESLKWIAEQKAVADKYHLALVAYEGGQHLVGVGNAPNNEALNKLLLAANASPRMGAIYDKYFDGWRAAGGGTFCYFNSVGIWSKWGSWGALQYWDDDPASSPKFQALVRFAKRCGQQVGAK